MSTWSELSTKDRAALIQMMAKEGISSLDEMEEYYNNATQEEPSDEEYSEEEPDEYFPMEASSQQGNSSLSSGNVTTGRQYYIKPDGSIGVKQGNTYDGGGYVGRAYNTVKRKAREKLVDWVGKIAGKIDRQIFDSKKVAERVPAEGLNGGIGDVIDATTGYFKNNDTYVGDRIAQYEKDLEDGLIDPDASNLETMKVHEDAKRIYLGQPQLYESLELSPYRPTIGKSDNPYQVNALLSDTEFDNTILPLYGAWKSGDNWPAYNTEGRVTNLGKTAQLKDIPHLQAAGLSEGFDDKGQYISLYDVWDYNTKVKNTNGDNIHKLVGGKPFDIYQRYYLDDWLDIPEEARGNPYIAPSYIEAEEQPYPDHLPDEWQGDAFAKGGKIHIKPENRGKFTALKKRTGHSATWFKQHGTPAQKKMAVFALNARKWKHGNGGQLNLAPYALGGPINPNNYLPSFIGRRKPLPDVRY